MHALHVLSFAQSKSDISAPYPQVNKLDWIVFNMALFCTMSAEVDIGLGISIRVSDTIPHTYQHDIHIELAGATTCR